MEPRYIPTGPSMSPEELHAVRSAADFLCRRSCAAHPSANSPVPKVVSALDEAVRGGTGEAAHSHTEKRIL